MATHELKTVNPHFQNLHDGIKTFEIRRNDRNFKVGDTLILREYHKERVVSHCRPSEIQETSYDYIPEEKRYTGRYLQCEISHIIDSMDYPEGLKEGYCILSLINIHRFSVM